MKFCTHCGAALSEDSLFCENCGTKCPAQTTPNTTYTQGTQNKCASIEKQTLATATKKRRKIISIVAILLIAALAIYFFVPGKEDKPQAPFYGVQRGDTAETVEKKMGTPDDFEGDSMQNFRYYYDDVEFLDMNGYVEFHFYLGKVDTLYFICPSAGMSEYDRALEHYTQKYGEPVWMSSDSESSCWELEDGNTLWVKYYSGSTYSYPEVTIQITT